VKVYVLCLGGSIAGGIECLVQLVDALRTLGIKAYLSYYPDGPKQTHQYFKDFGYNIEQASVEDNENNIVIIPEIHTKRAVLYPKSKKVIYWLSVDNYFQRKWNSKIKDFYMYFKTLKSARLPFSKMNNFSHITQSQYATDILREKGFKSYFIGDYLNDQFFDMSKVLESTKKENLVAFNPQKGLSFTNKLFLDQHIKTVPLIRMSREELIASLARAKVYVDFGHHPGRDRIPREAAVMRSCLITSKRGSAFNSHDIQISEDYKFDMKEYEVKNIVKTIRNIFDNYSMHLKEQNENRARILMDKKSFIRNVDGLLDHIYEKK